MARITPNSVLMHSAMRMPYIGLGTWQSTPAEIDVALEAAIDAGYRHIDTAFLYKNETAIGTSLKRLFDSGKIKREELFIVTKLPHWGMRAEDVEPYMKKSLAALQLDYVDLYLIHSAVGYLRSENDDVPFQKQELDMKTDHVAIWKAMEAQVDAGRTKFIGISKFKKSQIQRILDNCRIRPANVQMEMHIYNQEKELVSFCKENDITVCAFSAFGSPGSKVWSESARQAPSPLEDPVIIEIAKKYNKQASHILLRYFIEYGIAIIPKSVNPSRIKQNIDVFDFELTKAEYDRIKALDRGEKGRIFGAEFFASQVNHPEFPFPK